jgi:alkylation response protein AidB-like acyl-CoA dehydrogenase
MSLATSAAEALVRARAIADGVLFPAASRVDSSGQLPPRHLDLLAEQGLYGLAAVAGGTEFTAVVEALASGCLATAFVWLQHHGSVRAVDACDQPGVREQWLEPLCRGERRAGAVLGGLRPGPASLTARAVDGGYALDGEAPWVTGWGMVDVLYTAVRVPSESGDPMDDEILWLLVDCGQSTVEVTPLELSAVRASSTVSLRFVGHPVPADRLVARLSYRDWPERDLAGLRTNGSLALGLVSRCCTLIGPGPLDTELARCRGLLDCAASADLPAARAAASELAVRAAATLVTSTGARAVLAGETGMRLIREAAFLLVFGSRPGIRSELLTRLGDARL